MLEGTKYDQIKHINSFVYEWFHGDGIDKLCETNPLIYGWFYGGE